MEIEREVLLAAVKAANTVTVPTHMVSLFTKVWLLDHCVLAFNNTSTVINLPMDTPAFGGVDGKQLTQVLERSDHDTVDLEATEHGQLQVSGAGSTVKLSVLDPTEHVLGLVKQPKPGEIVLELDTNQFEDDIELDAMMILREVKSQKLEFSSFNLDAKAGRVAVFTSDHSTINRSVLDVEMPDNASPRIMIPVDFMRALKKLWPIFGGGSCIIDKKRIMLLGDEDALLYTSLLNSNEPINFAGAINSRFWPEGKVDRKLLVDIPEGLMEALDRVTVFAKGKPGKDADDRIVVTVADGKMTVVGQGNGGEVKEVIDTDHPDIRVALTPSLVKPFLKFSDRMLITSTGIALFGPKRFSRYIAGRG